MSGGRDIRGETFLNRSDSLDERRGRGLIASPFISTDSISNISNVKRARDARGGKWKVCGDSRRDGEEEDRDESKEFVSRWQSYISFV